MTPGSTVLIRRLFLAGVGVVWFFAFASLWAQIDGLVGSQGILPAATFLTHVGERLGGERHLALPTILWWLAPTDRILQTLSGAGVLLSLLLIAGVAPALNAALLWVIYLSLYGCCQSFLRFQWDILLLEMGFLSIFYAPPLAWLPRSSAWATPPSRLVTWLLRVLLFKLMFSSGIVKLASGDPTWWNLTALAVHYETTCLPTWTGWHMHQLPMWVHKASTALMFLLELVVPFFVFGPRRLRLVAALGSTGLMLFIGATGNYGFFNVQTIVLCLPLLDDDMLPVGIRDRLRRLLVMPPPDASRSGAWPWPVTLPIGVGIAALTIVPLTRAFRVPVEWPEPLATMQRWQRPFHLINGYGLFARMTTERPEIIIEGSNDGEHWEAYEFRWKPGAVDRRPGFVQPHMPRLDWRMWFAALGSARNEGWFYPFCQRLLEGSPPVLELLASNPFPEKPPRYLRATLYDYRFTGRGGDDDPDAWWRRQRLRPYTPVLYLDAGRQLRAKR